MFLVVGKGTRVVSIVKSRGGKTIKVEDSKNKKIKSRFFISEYTSISI
jgi:hypothetical protein